MSKVDFHCSVVNRVPLSLSLSLSLSYSLHLSLILSQWTYACLMLLYLAFLFIIRISSPFPLSPSLSPLSPSLPETLSLNSSWLAPTSMRTCFEFSPCLFSGCSYSSLSHFLPLTFSFSSSSLSLSPLLPSEQDSFSAGHCLQPSKDMKCKKWLRQRYSHSELEASAAEKAFEARAR